MKDNEPQAHDLPPDVQHAVRERDRLKDALRTLLDYDNDDGKVFMAPRWMADDARAVLESCK